MSPEFWLERWRNDQIGFHQDSVNAYLQRHLPLLRLAAGDRVFVPLCGKSRDMEWLARGGQSVVGVELSERAIRSFFDESQREPQIGSRPPFTLFSNDGIELLCGDFFELTRDRLGTFAAVYDRAALIALPDERRRGYLEALAALCDPGVPVLMITLEYPHGAMQGPPFSVTAAELGALSEGLFALEALERVDVLASSANFKARGLSELYEAAYLLTRRG